MVLDYWNWHALYTLYAYDGFSWFQLVQLNVELEKIVGQLNQWNYQVWYIQNCVGQATVGWYWARVVYGGTRQDNILQGGEGWNYSLDGISYKQQEWQRAELARIIQGKPIPRMLQGEAGQMVQDGATYCRCLG